MTHAEFRELWVGLWPGHPIGERAYTLAWRDVVAKAGEAKILAALKSWALESVTPPSLAEFAASVGVAQKRGAPGAQAPSTYACCGQTWTGWTAYARHLDDAHGGTAP